VCGEGVVDPVQTEPVGDERRRPDRAAVDALYRAHRPTWVVNFAAESHVDRSIVAPDAFIRTNVLGTQSLIEAARTRGLDVHADQYPYTAGSTSLYALVQNGALRRDSPGGVGSLSGDAVLIASAPKHPAYEGRRLGELAAEWGLDVEAAATRVIQEEGEACFVVLFSMDEADVRTVLAHPSTMIGSDGVPAAGSKPHPRLYGCFPRILGHYVRDERVLDLPTAIHKMTGLPATKFGFVDRGTVRPGAFADLVVFDPATIADVATYDDPCRFPAGIRAVFVNGTAVARDGEHTGARPGRALRRGASTP